MANKSSPKSRAAAAYALAVSHVKYGTPAARRQRTAAARAGMTALWLRAADPDGTLRPEEREHRAAALRRGWMTYLNYCHVVGRKPGSMAAWLEKYARWDEPAVRL